MKVTIELTEEDWVAVLVDLEVRHQDVFIEGYSAYKWDRGEEEKAKKETAAEMLARIIQIRLQLQKAQTKARNAEPAVTMCEACGGWGQIPVGNGWQGVTGYQSCQNCNGRGTL